ncbi:unnamed protein product [Effrenium voratum]|nr:unnamed protein product [Effrenium voratum]
MWIKDKRVARKLLGPFVYQHGGLLQGLILAIAAVATVASVDLCAAGGDGLGSARGCLEPVAAGGRLAPAALSPGAASASAGVAVGGLRGAAPQSPAPGRLKLRTSGQRAASERQRHARVLCHDANERDRGDLACMRYQKAVESCEDRRSLLKETRHIQFEVLPKFGIEASEKGTSIMAAWIGAAQGGIKEVEDAHFFVGERSFAVVNAPFASIESLSHEQAAETRHRASNMSIKKSLLYVL